MLTLIESASATVVAENRVSEGKTNVLGRSQRAG